MMMKLHKKQQQQQQLKAATTIIFRYNLTTIVNTTTLRPEIELDQQEQHPIVWKHPLLGVFLVMFSIITIFGNILVICAVVRERYLKSATNYYIVSLAVADVIVGLVVMPFNTLQEMMNNYWLFGQLWCDLWHSFDVFASTASILSLVTIALDRHSAISDPINYHTRWLTRHWILFVTGIWICSAFISFPAIAYWRNIAHKTNVTVTASPPNICAFTDDIYYLVFSSLVSFYIPLSVMIFVYIRIYRAATRQMTALKTGQKVNVKSSDGTQLTLRIHRGGYHRVDGTSGATVSGTGGGNSNNASGKSQNRKNSSSVAGSTRNIDHRRSSNASRTSGGASKMLPKSASNTNSCNKATSYLLSPTNHQKANSGGVAGGGGGFLIRTTSDEFLNTTTNGSSLSPSPTDDLRRFSFGNANMNKYASECCLYSQTFLSAGTISSSQSTMPRPSITTIQEDNNKSPPPTVVPTVVASTTIEPPPKPAKTSRMIKFKLSTSSSSKKDSAKKESTDAQADTQLQQQQQEQLQQKIMKKKSPTMSLRRLVLTSKNRLSGKKAAKQAAATAAAVETANAVAAAADQTAASLAASTTSTINTTAPSSATASPTKKSSSSSPTPKGKVMTSFKRLSSRFKLRKTIRFKDKMNSIDNSNNIATMTIPEIVYTESDDTIFQENLVYIRNNNAATATPPSSTSKQQQLPPLSPILDNSTPSTPTKPKPTASIETTVNNKLTDNITSETTTPAAAAVATVPKTPKSATKITNLDAILTLNSESDNLDEENDEAEDDDDVDYVNSFAAKQQEKQQQQKQLIGGMGAAKYKTTHFGKCLTSDDDFNKYSFLNQNDILAVTSPTAQQRKLSQKIQQQARENQPNQQETIVAAAAAAVLATMPLNIKRIQKQIQMNPHTLQFYHQHYYQHHLELQQQQALRHYSKRMQQRQQQQQQQQPLTQQQILRARNDSTASAYSSSSSSNRYSKAKLISKKMKSFNITKKFCKFSREQKAAKTLGIVMGVFIICWLPFFIYNVITGVFKAKLPKAHELIYAIFTWLGYINSGCNPIIYAFSSRDFRRAFYKLLCPTSFMRANQRLATRDCVSATEHTTLRLNSRRHAILNCHICQIYEATIQSNQALCPANFPPQMLKSSSTFSLNKISNAIGAAGGTGTGSATAASSTSSAAGVTAAAAAAANTSLVLHQQSAAVETTPLTSSLTHNRPNSHLKADKALNGLLKLNKITFEPSVNSTTSGGYQSGDSKYGGACVSAAGDRPVNMIERIRQRVLLTFSLTKKNSKQRKKQRHLKSRSISTCDSIISRSSNSSAYNSAASIYKRKCRNSKKRGSDRYHHHHNHQQQQQRNSLLKIYS